MSSEIGKNHGIVVIVLSVFGLGAGLYAVRCWIFGGKNKNNLKEDHNSNTKNQASELNNVDKNDSPQKQENPKTLSIVTDNMYIKNQPNQIISKENNTKVSAINLNNTTISDNVVVNFKYSPIVLEINRVNEFCFKRESELQINRKFSEDKVEFSKEKKPVNADEEFSNSDEKLNIHKQMVSKTPKSKIKFYIDKQIIAKKDQLNHLRKSSMNYRENNQDQSLTLLNIVQDLNIVDRINKGIQEYETNKIEIISEDGQDKELEKGYISEDDEDFDFEGAFLPEELNLNIGGDISQLIEGEIRKSHSNNEINFSQKSLFNNFNNKKITNYDDLHNILFNAKTGLPKKQSNLCINVETEFQKFEDDEQIEVIKAELLLVILKYLHSELHSGLIELSDTFVEQRRLFFEKDRKSYIAIIIYFLNKKDQFFLGILSVIMSTLNISQKLLDNSFIYYMNFADQNDEKVIQIKINYDKVYSAGIKKTIAPKNLNKNKLKEILVFQCQKYEELIEEFKNENPLNKDDTVDIMDIIEVIVIDYTYVEFGFDREAVKAAEKKLAIDQDPDLVVYLNKLSGFTKDNFLKI